MSKRGLCVAMGFIIEEKRGEPLCQEHQLGQVEYVKDLIKIDSTTYGTVLNLIWYTTYHSVLLDSLLLCTIIWYHTIHAHHIA